MVGLLVILGHAAPAGAQSCGELGGDYCSQTGGCPGGYNSLGQTLDCNPCCQSGPSCGAIGGNWCSQSGSCPPGYQSLGQTYDCNPCCQQGVQGTMNFSIFIDSWMTAGYIYGSSNVIDNSSGCSHFNYRTFTDLRSPSGRYAIGEASGLGAGANLPIAGEFGNYTIVTWGDYGCSCVGTSSFGPTQRSVQVCAVPVNFQQSGPGIPNNTTGSLTSITLGTRVPGGYRTSSNVSSAKVSVTPAAIHSHSQPHSPLSRCPIQR